MEIRDINLKFISTCLRIGIYVGMFRDESGKLDPFSLKEFTSRVENLKSKFHSIGAELNFETCNANL